jgi:cytochrome P450
MTIASDHGSGEAAAEALANRLFLTPEGRTDPYPIYHRLRDLRPVHRTGRGIWLLGRYDDCRAALRDPRLGKDYISQVEQRFGPD